MNKIMSPFGGSPVGGKKFLFRGGMFLGTLGLVVAGAAAFSAFEAHVVNVTATINNATDISTQAITFGNVFPQEILHNPVTLSLSTSFLSQSNTGASSVDYVLKQKPKCMATDPANPVQFAQVLDVTNPDTKAVTFTCPTGYNAMPLLCPYLSKTSPTAGDTSVLSFHGPTALTDWTDAVSVANQATGHLSIGGTQSTTWDIDLHTPCFKTECAQDWASFVTTANPAVTDPAVIAGYESDPANKGVAMGCDLWYEVSGINACTVQATQNIVSDTTNTVEETSANAFALSFIHPGWTASIPGATWIWSSDPVATPTTIDDTKTFDKTFTISGPVSTASLDIAADNFYTVSVNGIQVGSEQSDPNNFQLATQDHYTVTNLVSGVNTIKVVARNMGVAGSTPASNPAGILYKLTYTDTEGCPND
jgi:hypothetical protein